MKDHPVTFICNNNCVSCINDMVFYEDEGVLAKKGSIHVPTKQLKDFIDSIDTSKHNTVGFSGGEPTISEDFFEVLEYAREKLEDFLIFVVSNGRAFSKFSFIKKMTSYAPPHEKIRFGVAIYGSKAETHDSITRAKGSFKQTVQGVKKLLAAGYETELRVIINGMNYKNLPEIAEWVSENLNGVFRVVFIHMKYTGNALKNIDDVKVKISDANPYAVKAVEKLESENINVKMFHFPLCTIPEKHWDKAKGVTKQKNELTFSEKCEKCVMRDECPMLWSTYHKLFGDDEIAPITDEEN